MTGAITAMAALTLAACSNNNADAKPGASEPKTEQSSKNTDQSSEDSLNFSDDTTQSSSEAESSSEKQKIRTLDGLVNDLKDADFKVINTEGSTDTSFYVNVEINGYEGFVDTNPYIDAIQVNFEKSLGDGKSDTAHNNEELANIANYIKKYTSQK